MIWEHDMDMSMEKAIKREVGGDIALYSDHQMAEEAAALFDLCHKGSTQAMYTISKDQIR